MGLSVEAAGAAFVVTPTREQLRQVRLSDKFNVLYNAQVRDFREFLIKYPMLGAEHLFGRVLSKVMKTAKQSVLEPSVWYRATQNIDEP